MWALQRLRRILSTPGTCDAPASANYEASENAAVRSAVSSTMMSPKGFLKKITFSFISERFGKPFGKTANDF